VVSVALHGRLRRMTCCSAKIFPLGSSDSYVEVLLLMEVVVFFFCCRLNAELSLVLKWTSPVVDCKEDVGREEDKILR